MSMPGRKYEAQSGYRYGFNGKEKDKDLNSLTAYDYGFRIYNPGIGKFLSVDPLSKSYPWLTPFQFAGNVPIAAVDLDGLESKIVVVGTRSLNVLNSSNANREIRQAGLRSQIVNHISSLLVIQNRQADKGNYLTTEERTVLIRETISSCLVFNQVETPVKSISGQVSLVEQITTDLNYDFIFGSKESPKISEVKEMFDIIFEAYSAYSDATGKSSLLDCTLKGAQKSYQIINKEFLSLASEIVKEVAEKTVDKTVEAGIARGLLPESAKFLSSRALGTFFLVLTPTEMGGASTADWEAGRKKSEAEELHRNVIGALLFLFLNGNTFSESELKKMIQNNQREKIDKTKYNGNVPLENTTQPTSNNGATLTNGN